MRRSRGKKRGEGASSKITAGKAMRLGENTLRGGYYEKSGKRDAGLQNKGKKTEGPKDDALLAQRGSTQQRRKKKGGGKKRQCFESKSQKKGP